MFSKRLFETVAMMIIGDSVLCILSPRRHLSLWMKGPHWWQRAWRPFMRHPDLTRGLGFVGLIVGLGLAWKQEPTVELEERESAKLPRRLARKLEEVAR